MYYVYIIKCRGDLLYTGITTDIRRRLDEHSGTTGKGAKFTRSHEVESLEALWSTENRSLASKLEYRIKQLPKQRKLRLIEDKRSFTEFFGEAAAKLYTRESLPAAADGSGVVCG